MTVSQETARSVEPADTIPSAEQVEAYLRANPAFLNERPDLIAVLAPPSRFEAGAVVDLQAMMLQRLREESRDLRDATNLLISTTRSNMIIQTRTHAGVMAMLGADDFDRLIHVVRYDLPLLLDVDTVSLCFETSASNPPELTDVRWVPEGSVAQLLGGNEHPACRMIEDVIDDGQAFGEASGIVRSAAVARVVPGSGIASGLIALGARERGAFHSGQASDLLTFLAKVTEMCLHRWLPTTLA